MAKLRRNRSFVAWRARRARSTRFGLGRDNIDFSYGAGAGIGRMLDIFQPVAVFTRS